MFHKGKHNREKQLRFSIRKVSFGAASVAVAALFMFLGNGAVSATEQGVPSTNGETLAPQPKDQNIQNGTYEGNTVANSPAATVETNTQPSTVENSPSPESAPQKVETLDKKELTDLIKEIDGKLSQGTYATKTEESVNNLRTVLEEARTTLNNAKTQAELSQAQAKLVTATTKLQTKPEEKKEAPAVDTINGKATVGKKATNTEKSSESNSIANSGSRDERNGKALDANNPFRTDAATTDTDPAANQTYTAPAADANLETLTKKLKTLPNYIENNKKVQDMDTLGNEKGVAAGSVAEITEFGGWKAVNQEDGSAGKFAIAKATDKGVFPVETMNILGSAATAYVGEQSFDRTSKYMLFLSEVRTQATKTKEAYDNSAWSDSDGTFGKHTSKAVKGYNGIEKTFKVYSSDKNTKVNLEFKTGFSGHLDHPDGSSRANYKVEVFSIDSNNSETKVYEATFDPSVAKDDSVMKVTPAKDSTSRKQSFNIPANNKEAALEKFAENDYKPYATGGTFTAKNINLPAGSQSYKVRISSAYNGKLGLDYHSNYESYALPVTGLDFNIDQDTGAIAKDLLSRIYDKLKVTETADTDGKTNETKDAYLAELENIKTLVTNTDVKKTAEYKVALESILSKQLALKVDKTGLTDSKASLDDLVKEDPTPGKTKDTATAYNEAKQEAIKAIETAKTVIAKTDATVAQVREALATVNAKKAALQQAKDGLIVAATTEEKAKLKTDSDALKKVDTTGKTADSIKVYEAEFEKLKNQLEVAKNEAAAVLAKENNASKAEVQAAQAKVDAAKTALDKAAESLKDIDRDAAKKEIADAAKKATDAIEASTSLTQEQKAEEKAKVAKEAKDATDAIDNATTEEGINSAKENGKLAIEKETAITAINAEKAAKEQEIDNNTKLSDEEKSAAKAEVAKAAIEAVEAIKKADSKDAVDAAKAEGEKAIKAVNPIGKEKVLDAIQKAAEEKIAEIDKNDKLSAEEKAAAKAEVAKAAIEAVEAIKKAATQSEVDAAQAKGETAIKAVNPVGKAQAKAAIDKALAEKEKAIDARTDLTDAEKEVAKKSARAEAESAKKAIDNAIDSEAVEKALRTFLYQIDQESLVYDRPTFNLEAYIQASITGVVKVERGKVITQADIISKLSLPESVTVISIDLPDTNTLGDKFAKAILRLADGIEVTVKVPVRVVAPQNGDSKPDTSLPNHGANNGTTNTDVKVDKAKLEGAIRQLDELIIKESAKLDAETAKEANDLLADAKKVFANADATQAEVDAMVKRIEDFMAKVASATDHATPANDQDAQTPANAGQTASAQANARKAAKELPNTGTADSTVAMVAAAASALLGLGLAGHRRKEDEEA